MGKGEKNIEKSIEIIKIKIVMATKKIEIR
jgi:hypothetical protein